ncbi:LysR family transcriptional regulator [Pseudohalocynthiibacter aestuariivivens]|nr:LysR family transcriptional regulator [Pseudohalocynthiibacter aestuariivivens]QIE44924.1 LysR family transcriptional regulator [Pseudohalocynthiibacter aestuariivivens]
MNIDPRLLRIFVAVMHRGSVTRAAEQLNTSQPSVSKALKRLEELVGFCLFKPQGRSIQPTAKAQLLLESAMRVERELEEIDHRIMEIRHGRMQGLRIAVTPAIAAALLPRAIIEFRKTYPDTTLEIELWRRELILSELDAGRVEIGLLYSTTQSVPAGFRIVAEAPTLCVLPKGHTLCAKAVVTAADLYGHKLLIYHNSLDFADRLWSVLKTIDPEPEIVIEANQGAFLRDLVINGIGISLLDGFTVMDADMRGLVTRPFLPAMPFYLAIADQEPRLTAQGREFIRIISAIAVQLQMDLQQ